MTAYIVVLRVAKRCRLAPNTQRRGSLSTVSFIIASLMVVLTAAATVMTHADAAEMAANLGKPMCEG